MGDKTERDNVAQVENDIKPRHQTHLKLSLFPQ